MKKNPYIGSRFEEFKKLVLKDPEAKQAYEEARLRRKIRARVLQIIEEKQLSVRKLAERMDTSVSQVQRLMSEENISIQTLARFARATGKKLSIEIQ